jgi:hypothetical protein
MTRIERIVKIGPLEVYGIRRAHPFPELQAAVSDLKREIYKIMEKAVDPILRFLIKALRNKKDDHSGIS